MRKKNILLGVIVAIGLAFLATWAFYPSREELLIRHIKDTVKYQEFLAQDNLLESSEGHYGLNGDVELSGVFQLSSEEADVLLGADQVMKCPEERSCELESYEYDDGAKSFTVHVSGGITWTLLVDGMNGRVTYSVFWY